MPRMAFSSYLLLILLPSLSWATYSEVLSHEIGPRSVHSTNNTNSFQWGLVPDPPETHANCDLIRFQNEYGRAPCPQDMQWVCSRYFSISICIDRDLASDSMLLPIGNMNRIRCEDFCHSQGKRLLTNNEWLVGCTGSPIDKCLNYMGEWPPGFFAKVPNHPCHIYGTNSVQCMRDPSLTKLLPKISESCQSEAGVRGCIGTLGQWVSNSVSVEGSFFSTRGKFNGGLFPQIASSVIYTTTAHLPSYSDYSIGCRCGRDVGI